MMPTYKNANLDMTTGAADVYTAPTAGAQVTMIQVANVDGTNAADATVWWTDSSDTDKVTHLAYQVEVAAQDSLSVQAGGLVLENGDKIRALASANSDLEISVCVIEN